MRPCAMTGAKTSIRLATVLVWIVFAGSGLSEEQLNAKAPWPPLYKIKPQQKERLTQADVVGPDGIVYPNWTKCGVQGGIPDVKVVARIEDFGGKPNDDADDSQALEQACRSAGKTGGAVLLGEGTYYLDRPVTVRSDKVVIRGMGPSPVRDPLAEKTRVIFRYSIPEPGVAFYWPPANAKIGPDSMIEMHARPTGLMKMTVLADDQVISTWSRSQHSGNTFSFAVRGRDAITKVGAGQHTLKGVAEYSDGKNLSAEIPVITDPSFRDSLPVPDSRAAIMFAGKGTTGPRIELAKDGKRGDRQLHLRSTEGLAVGDCIFIDGPATDRWKKLTKNACLWGMYRNYEVIVTSVEGNTVSIGQPLRIEFPVIDGSYIQKVEPIRHCGVEDLYIEQTENL